MPIDAALAARLATIVGERRVLLRESELRVYTADGLPRYDKRPALAVFPGTREEVVGVVRELAAANVPFVPRGAGTGLSGGALAEGSVLLGLNRLTRIMSIDPLDALAVVEPGVVNAKLTRAASAHGMHYAPDPSSQTVCTIGGNVAENAARGLWLDRQRGTGGVGDHRVRYRSGGTRDDGQRDDSRRRSIDLRRRL